MSRRRNITRLQLVSCPMPRPLRLEWIYLAYLACFALATLSPSLYTRGYLGFSEKTLEEFTIFVFGVAGLFIFTTYERFMERREQEQEQVEVDYLRLKSELIESYAYIGSMNRKLELLKRLTNATSAPLGTKRVAKELFGALVSQAAAAADADAVLLRCMDVSHLRTEHEFSFVKPGTPMVVAANKDLRSAIDQGGTPTFIRTNQGREIFVVPSDSTRDVRAFLLMSWKDGSLPEIDTSLLKVFANQAESLAERIFPGTAAEKPSKELLAASSQNR